MNSAVEAGATAIEVGVALARVGSVAIRSSRPVGLTRLFVGRAAADTPPLARRPGGAARRAAPRNPFDVDGGRAGATIGRGGVRRCPRGRLGRRECRVRRGGKRAWALPPAGRNRAGRTNLGLRDRRADRVEFSPGGRFVAALVGSPRVAARRLASLIGPCVVFAVVLKEPARA
jgi:hypothetical protein